MKTFQEWLEIREGSQGLKARQRRAVGLAKRAQTLGSYGMARSTAAEELAQDAERAAQAAAEADRRMSRRETNRRNVIASRSKEGRVMARETPPDLLRANRMRSRNTIVGMQGSFFKNRDGSYGSAVTPDEIRQNRNHDPGRVAAAPPSGAISGRIRPA